MSKQEKFLTQAIAKNLNTDNESLVMVEQIGNLGRIRLNRPGAINALNPEMIRIMSDALELFESQDDVHAVLVTGEGDRGFCAGGDVKAIYHAGAELGAKFWSKEYQLNYQIAQYTKPYIAIMDGITMGGGFGISAHGQYRIVTERSRLAMPETAIGFFPDVGASWLLSRTPGETGTYIALSGASFNAADAMFAGLADVQIASSDIEALIDAMANLQEVSHEKLKALFESFSALTESSSLQNNLHAINGAFGLDSIEAIMAQLDNQKDEFSQQTLELLKTRSPTSLKLTLQLMRLGRESISLRDCLEREFAAGVRLLHGHDFFEGVRAVLVDKDNAPQWQPDRLGDVADENIGNCLQPLERGLFAAS